MLRSRVFSLALVTAIAAAAAAWVLPASVIARQSAIRFARCPRVKKKEGAEVTTDRNPRAAEATVPMSPSAVQLCRYYGLGFHQTDETLARVGKLRDERILTEAATARSIAEEFDSLQSFPEGPTNCPADEGARLYAVFGYANGESTVPVEVNLSGCSFVSNGQAGSYWATPQLIRRLKALTSIAS